MPSESATQNAGAATSPWPRVAVVGAGAVGSYFGGLLARAGAPVTLIGRAAHVAAIAGQGLLLDTLAFKERIRAAATTHIAAVRDAEFVWLCVKTRDTEAVAREVAAHISPGAAVFSLQNGVDNAERIRAAAGIAAVPCVVYVGAAIPAPGVVKHSGGGRLVLGPGAASERLARTLARARIPCQVSENITAELWKKLALNCAGNAVTALGRASYGQVAAHTLATEVMNAAIEETLAVARAAGIVIPPEDFAATVAQLGRALGAATSSTAQDLLRGRRTEMESLNGYVVRRGAELGVPTPVNHTLYAMVKLLEESVGTTEGTADEHK